MRNKPSRRTSQIRTVGAPTGGIDDTSSLENMEPQFALDILNMFPAATELVVRYGYEEWVTGFSAPVRTIMSYNGGTVSRLLAATDDGIYNITSPGAVGASIKTITDGRLNTTMFSNVANQYLIGCNGGSDPNWLYNGTSFTNFVFDATPVNPGEIDGVNPDVWCNVCSHKKRLWFVQENSMTAWYLPVDSIGGVAKPFYLGGVFSRGGKLVNIMTWSLDAGYSVDDILIFQSSNGEIAGFAGTDPDNAGTWWQEAVYFIGAPMGDRTNTDLSGDLAMLTSYGLIPISKIIANTNQAGPSEDALSKRISKTLNTIVRNRANNPLWEIITLPTLQYCMIIIPAALDLPATQYVMNMVTGAWGRFTLPMLTAANYNEELYFSDDVSTVYKYGNVFTDGVTLAGGEGETILSGFMQAYYNFGAPEHNKHYKLVRPIFSGITRPSYLIDISADYEPGGLDSLGTPPSVAIAASNVWDVGLWDVATWANVATSHFEWNGVDGVGYSAALIIKMNTRLDTSYVSCNWAFESGNSI